MTTLLREVIDIPERYGAEDYVLKLTDSVGGSATARTIDAYVVTEQLAQAFDDALGVIGDAVANRTSRGAFLIGSFGSGKSHFMAVLHAMLRQDPAARAKPDLQPVIERHDGQLAGAKVLPLAFHLLAASSMEQALFEGYLRQIRNLHPGVPLPALHKSDGLLDDADNLRATLGDAVFFARLNGGADDDADADSGDDEWGEVLGAGTWNADTYVQARAAAPGSETRQKLVSALVERFFTSFTRQGEYVDIDTGLSVIAAHAKSLGYDAVVLFLDELVLWLASSVQDRPFFARESQKITKLVESAVGHREIPVVSFVARQMNLSKWFADSGASGAEQEALDRAFKHQEGRFAQITLGDNNLSYVANQRLLQPRDEAARAVLDDAFAGIDRRPAVWDVLLDGVNTDDAHRGADAAAFRLTYPFSPALVSTLRSLAGVMQRERTALKVMQRMLVERRDDLTIDEVIPVGDAFDLVVDSEAGQPLDAQAASLFRAALKLYREKLRPAILASKNLADDQALAAADPRVRAQVAADERLAKTLLLSAVAPKVPALKDLTPQRLAALNHGSIISPLPGGEAGLVASTVRHWARTVPEIRFDGDDRNPTIRVQLSDIDHESIVEKAKVEDNEGRRRELVARLVADAIGLQRAAASALTPDAVELVWRGTLRRVEVVFGNVRDGSWLAEDVFHASPGAWRVIIDHPFDEAGHTSSEDFARLDRLQASGLSTQTLVWLPRFLSDATMRDLRRLVILEYLLASGSNDRWMQYADHLNEGDRMQAKAMLEGQRKNLEHSVGDAIDQAYGISSARPGVLEEAEHGDLLFSFDVRYAPRTPAGASLGAAFQRLADDAYAATYPEHPAFAPSDEQLRARDYKAVAEALTKALDDPMRRVALATIPAQAGSVRRIVADLGLGVVNDQYVVFGDQYFTPWGVELEKGLGARGVDRANDPVSVRDLRSWIRAVPKGVGLPTEAVDLVILTFAGLRQMGWRIGTAPVTETPEPGKISDHLELRPEPLPSVDAWRAAGTLASALLGLPPASPHVTTRALGAFETAVADKLAAALPSQPDLVPAIERAYRELGISSGDRLRTAQTAAAVLRELKALSGIRLVERMAAVAAGLNAAAMARSIKTAADVAGALKRFDWSRLEDLLAAAGGEGPDSDAAASILTTLRTALAADEFVTSAAQALRDADTAAYQWLRNRARSTPPPAPTAPPAGGRPSGPAPVMPPVDAPSGGAPAGTQAGAGRAGGSGVARRRAGETNAAIVRELTAFLDAHPDATITVTWGVDE